MLCNQNPDKWRRIAMTEKLLRDVIKEAKEKKQLGIVIWSSWTTWENMGQGNKEVDEYKMWVFNASIYCNSCRKVRSWRKIF